MQLIARAALEHSAPEDADAAALRAAAGAAEAERAAAELAERCVPRPDP